MTDNEKLIEEAAQAIYGHNPEQQPWDGEPMGLAEAGDSHRANMARRQAEDAMAVFEKAHTPTDDEREALAKVIDDAADAPVSPERVRASLTLWLADAILAAGFRRTEVPEPSTELRPCRLPQSAPPCIGCQCETQGEPSSEAPKKLVYEVNMLLHSVASHGPAALTDTSDRMYTPGLLRRLRDALDPQPAQRLAAGNAVRAEMARNGLDVHRMIYGQEIANVLASTALDAALSAASSVTKGENTDA